jgi:hypothetical protein
MLKQFAPKDKMPPSPNSSACSSSATDTQTQAAEGPMRMAMSVPPTAWPLVPPGRGTLYIIMRNVSAAPMPSCGSLAFGSSFLTFLMANAHTGTIAAVMTAQVTGLR